MDDVAGIVQTRLITRWRENMTNGDKIRAMSNRELAVVMMCPYDMPEPLPESCIFKGCMECCQEWLQNDIDDN